MTVQLSRLTSNSLQRWLSELILPVLLKAWTKWTNF